jgi:hypothetical protein
MNKSGGIKKQIKLSNQEKGVISYIYNFLKENKKWPGIRTMHQKFGKAALLLLLSREDPVLIWEEKGSDLIEIYGLTFEGIYFCPSAQKDLELLQRFFHFLLKKLKKNPELREVKCLEIESSLGLSKLESFVLRYFIALGGFFGSGSFGEEWCMQLPEDIEDLMELGDEQKYISKHREMYFRKREKPLGGLKVHNVGKMTDGWLEIEKEFDISKNQFGRKINFVSDRFKRDVIFRDVEQAYALSKLGFSKSAVILAGSVVEELLRLYLLSKRIKPKNNGFECYIMTCEENGLLKKAIHRLSDSIRCFRNLVHLAIESEERYSISRPTATAAVASIFTIANDF